MVLAGEAGLSGIPLFEPNLKRETTMFDLQSFTSALIMADCDCADCVSATSA